MLSVFVICACFMAAQCAWVEEMENKDLWQGDIVLDPDEIETTWNKSQHTAYASIKGGRWPGGKVPYVIEGSISSRGVQVINAAISNYHKYTCLRFHRRTNERSYLSFWRGSGCSSPVGYRYGRVNRISLASGCWYTGIVMHEIGHSMGFYHEQSRPDRDQHVRIIWNNIQRDMQFNFNKFDTRTINSLGTPYDYSSMMHYGSTAFGRGRQTIQTIDRSKQRLIGQRNGFSQIDIKQLGLMYNRECSNGGSTGGSTGSGSGSSCTDKNSNCARWARGGYCRNPRNARWMSANCCASCKIMG